MECQPFPVRISSTKQDSSGKRFMQMLENALAEKCGFRHMAARWWTRAVELSDQL
jgi:hypothetical protein